MRLTRSAFRKAVPFDGGIQFGFMYVTYVAAYQYLPAHVIALMTTTTPLFVTVFNDLWTKKTHKTFFVAALLAVAGGAVIELPDQPLAASLRGIILLQLSNAAFAFGQLTKNGWPPGRTCATVTYSASCIAARS
jgi:drug/metabolite transporter (DMT)-like permease